MSFKVTTLKLENFRSYDKILFEFSPDLTIIHGPNATGKTNCIEALQLLTEGVSFRRPSWHDVVRTGAERAFAQITAEDHGRFREVELTLQDGRRFFKVNGKALRSAAQVAGIIPCVVFTPIDLRIVREASSQRREELDNLGAQIASNYGKLRSEYKKIVAQRNRLLKDDICAGDLFDAWSQRLVEVGVALCDRRVALFRQLMPAIVDAYHHIDPYNLLEVSYQASWIDLESRPYEDYSAEEKQAAYRQALEEAAPADRARHLSTVGAHHDDLFFSLGGMAARIFASQGQQRSIALAWKLAEIEVIASLTGARPLLLLDDVMSELDERRREALTAFVGTVAQTVVTTANIDYFRPELLERAHLINTEELL